MMNSKASSIRPPLQPWSSPLVSQSTSSCSERDINFPVESWVIPSVAATAENAQQQPIYVLHGFDKRVDVSVCLKEIENENVSHFENW
jgi:hypothetical protein